MIEERTKARAFLIVGQEEVVDNEATLPSLPNNKKKGDAAEDDDDDAAAVSVQPVR